jgi:murein DD-endopeptidase MepM/ murein hydrolase activator NlpD
LFAQIQLVANINKEPIDLKAKDWCLIFDKEKSSKAILDLAIQINPFVVFKWSKTEGIHLIRLPSTLETRLMGSYIKEKSLVKTLGALELPKDIVQKLSDAFDWSVDFFNFKEGDYIKVSVEQIMVNGKAVKTARLLGAEIQCSGLRVFAFEQANGNSISYYNEKGENLRKPFLKCPLDYAEISSNFNYNRFHPILQRFKPHLGIDYVAPYGSPIRSVADGKIEEAGQKGGNGIYVRIAHGKGLETGYLHMSALAEGISSGMSVKQGQVIGYLGNTGLSTAPHLCFRFWKDGTPSDPDRLQLMNNDPVVLPEPDLSTFVSRVRPLKNQLAEYGLSNENEGLHF